MRTYLTLSLSLTLGLPACAPDDDDDGVANDDDLCPDEKEDKDGVDDDDGCSEDEVPDSFRMTFAGGTVCAPLQSVTGASASDENVPAIPVRIERCVYRCNQEPLPPQRPFYYYFACGGGVCGIVLFLPHAFEAVTDEEYCDARYIDEIEPPDDECTPQTFELSVPVPRLGDGTYPTGYTAIILPELTLEETNDAWDVLSAGGTLLQALGMTLQGMSFDDRQVIVELDPSNPAPPAAGDLSGAACTEIDYPIPAEQDPHG